jgi:hypothetical protein
VKGIVEPSDPRVALAGRRGRVVEILIVLVLLQAVFVIAIWSSVSTFFARGRLRGMQEATQEIIRGVHSHYEVAGEAIPAGVAKAIDAVKAATAGASYNKKIHRYHTHLWVFGDAIGEACWRRGYDVCKRTMTPKQDIILVELSLKELLHLTWLAHLGFNHMMPNYRGFESYRFTGDEDARGGTRAIERLEAAIPAEHRPFDDAAAQAGSRRKLITEWWSPKLMSA